MYIVNYVRNITIPVLPQGLQIMADQGFRHQPPIIVLPKANRPVFTAEMCKYVNNCIYSIRDSYQKQLSCSLPIIELFYTKSFCINFQVIQVTEVNDRTLFWDFEKFLHCCGNQEVPE